MANTLYTAAEIAEDFALFRAWIDLDGLVSEAEWEAADPATRRSWVDDCGFEDPVCCADNPDDHRVDEADAEYWGWRYQDDTWLCPQCQARRARPTCEWGECTWVGPVEPVTYPDGRVLHCCDECAVVAKQEVAHLEREAASDARE